MRRKASEIIFEADSDALFCELNEVMASEREKLTISDAFFDEKMLCGGGCALTSVCTLTKYRFYIKVPLYNY